MKFGTKLRFILYMCKKLLYYDIVIFRSAFKSFFNP
jgi:hypothetical protein